MKSEFREEGLALAAAHLATVALLLLAIARPPTGEWGGCLPMSLLTVMDLPLSLAPFFFPKLELDPTAGLSGWLGRGIIHGVIGTVWYYFLPRVIRTFRWKS